jgi:hypothetical protein
MTQITRVRDKLPSAVALTVAAIVLPLLTGCDCHCDRNCVCSYSGPNGEPVISVSCPAGEDEDTCRRNCTNDGLSPICRYQ